MTTFLFWNVRRKPLESTIARLVERHEVDVVLLAEPGTPEVALRRELNKASLRPFRRVPFVAFTRVELYSRLPSACFGPPVREEDHYAIRSLRVPHGIEVLLAVAHLPSPLHKKPSDLRSVCGGLAEDIGRAEEEVKNDRTVLIGDLNVNPFHDGMLDVRGLNAVADRETVRRKDPRTFGRRGQRTFRMFYNPMWGHFGDAAAPPGTYYYDQSNPEVDPLWNVFDQVLLRKALLDRFDHAQLEILVSDGQVSLTRPDGRPDAERASDHLPLLFRLDLRRRADHAG